MPKITIRAPHGALDAAARAAIAAELTEFALDCEGLPKSDFVRSTVWIYYVEHDRGCVYMGARPAYRPVVTLEVYVIAGGLDAAARLRFIRGATALVGRRLSPASTAAPPVYIVIHEVAEANWGIFGEPGNLAALRASPPDAPAI